MTDIKKLEELIAQTKRVTPELYETYMLWYEEEDVTLDGVRDALRVVSNVKDEKTLEGYCDRILSNISPDIHRNLAFSFNCVMILTPEETLTKQDKMYLNCLKKFL